MNSVSQRQLTEEIQDVFIAGEQRRTGFHWRRRLVPMASGFVIGVLATASVGTILDSQSNRNYLSKTAARIWDQVSWRATVETGPVEQLALHEGRTKELNVQPEASAKSPIPSQAPEESGAGANPTPILEARRSDVSQAADAPNRFKEKPTVDSDKKNQEATSTATKATGKNQVGVGRMSASSRLAIDIHKAIANRAITGVEVSVIDGTVFLSGRVASENHKILAAQAARNVPGVTYLRDQIIVNDDAAS